MTLLLNEDEVESLISMPEAVSAVEESFKEQANARALNSPRTRSVAPGSILNVMHASLQYLGRSGLKVYTSTKHGANFVVLLFDLKSGELLSVMAADALGRFRTGAASAVATKYLSRLKEFTLAIAGSGRQALTQVLSMREIAELVGVRVWSPTAEHRERFARMLSRELGLEASAHKTVEEAFSGSEVATTITTSKDPFVGRRAIETLSHLNGCGANWGDRSEVSPGAVASFSTICVDDLQQSMVEAGDLVLAAKRRKISWGRVVELKDVVSLRVKPRGRTYFKSNGVAIEDVAVASLIYEKALRRVGVREFDFRPRLR